MVTHYKIIVIQNTSRDKIKHITDHVTISNIEERKKKPIKITKQDYLTTVHITQLQTHASTGLLPRRNSTYHKI